MSSPNRRLARIAAVALAGLALLMAGLPTAAQASAPRIVGGNPVDITAVPWQVLLLINNTTQCGGAIIADTWLLTAAHCMDGISPAQVQAFAGVTDQNHMSRDHLLQVNRVIVNPNWNSANYSSDLALIGLAAPIAVSASQQPIALPLVQDANAWPAAGELATISGWGTTTVSGSSSALLREATVQILTSPTDSSCGEYGSSFVAANHVCAGMPQGGVDACQGDSGGPLSVKYNGVPTLAGIVSSGSGCADPKYPGLYTRVTSFLPWLRQYMALPQSPPGSPTNVTAEALARNRVLVTWTPPVNDGGAAVSYVATASPSATTCSSEQTSCVISGLTPGSSATVTVTAGNSIGLSAPSAPSAQITAVSGTSKVGATVRSATVRAWAGTRSGTIRVLSRQQCSLTSKGVRLLRAGLCAVRVSGSAQKVVILGVA